MALFIVNSGVLWFQVVHKDQWWVGCALCTDEDSETLIVNLLYPQDLSKYPEYDSHILHRFSS